MVELFAIPGFSEDSRAGHGPVARVAALRAPHAGKVERASRDSHPNCAMQVALWPEPPAWDLHPLRRSRSLTRRIELCSTVAMQLLRLWRKRRVKDVSPSPRQLRDRIEREDYSENA